MRINIREKEDVVILDLEGNIDINASDFIETVGWIILNKSKNILCNFEDVEMVDYIGISVIAIAYKKVLNNKGKMKLYNIPVHVRNLFAVVGLDRIFDYYETEEEALNSFREENIFSKILEKKLRRRFKRIPFKGIIEYKQKFSSQKEFYRGKILNLSAIGVFVISENIYPVGEILTIKLNISPIQEVVELDAKVVWIADSEIQPLESPGMGLEFYNIDSGIQKKIIEFIERHITCSPNGIE